MADAAKEWLEAYVRHNRSPYNLRLAEATLRRYLVPFMGQERIEDVTSRTLYAYRNRVAEMSHWNTERPLSRTTIRHILADCRALLNFCLNVGLLDRSPIPTRGWMPRIPERAPDTLTREECAVLRGLPEPHGFVLRFLLASGLSWGELVRAQAADIKNGVPLVPKSKSGKVRRVPLPQDVLAECRGRVGRLSPFDLAGNFNTQVRRLSGVTRFHVHLTRHTFASQWREDGGSLAALKEVLGHSTIKVTEQYGTVSDDLVLREAKRVEARRCGTDCGTFPEGESVIGGGTEIRTRE